MLSCSFFICLSLCYISQRIFNNKLINITDKYHSDIELFIQSYILMNWHLCPWDALDSERVFEPKPQPIKQSTKIPKKRPSTAHPITKYNSIPLQKQYEKKCRKHTTRKMSAKEQLQRQFILLQSEQLPLRQKNTKELKTLAINPSQFHISESTNKTKIHTQSSHKKLYSSHKNFYSRPKYSKQSTEILKLTPNNAANTNKIVLEGPRNRQTQKDIMLSTKLSKLIRKVNKKEDGTANKKSSVRKNGFIYFNQQIQ